MGEQSHLSPLSVIDNGSTTGHPAHRTVLQLQLQLPMMHCEHNPRAVEVSPREEDHPLWVVSAEVKLC